MTRPQFESWLSLAWPHGYRIRKTVPCASTPSVFLDMIVGNSSAALASATLTQYTWDTLARKAHDALNRLWELNPGLWPDGATIPMPPF
ncbi:MAG TPA: hypothetical protein VJ808_05090 [Gemmatimonadales bacterium]|nr:hypothetical protein [Gemmatimonadales bacterium]